MSNTHLLVHELCLEVNEYFITKIHVKVICTNFKLMFWVARWNFIRCLFSECLLLGFLLQQWLI